MFSLKQIQVDKYRNNNRHVHTHGLMHTYVFKLCLPGGPRANNKVHNQHPILVSNAILPWKELRILRKVTSSGQRIYKMSPEHPGGQKNKEVLRHKPMGEYQKDKGAKWKGSQWLELGQLGEQNKYWSHEL